MSDVPSSLKPNEELGLPAANAAPTAPLDLSGGADASQVIDPTTNKVLNIPHDNLEVAIRSGQYKPLPGVNYGVKDSHGVITDVSGEDLPAALQSNATIAPAAETLHYRNMQKYKDSEVTAGVEGFNRGFLPGVADRLMGGKDFNGNPITKEVLEARSEANPVSSMIGEAAGTILSPLGKLAVGTGAATETALTKIALKAGLTNKVAQAIVSKIAPAAAGSAVEGAFFGGYHLLNENALGTAQFNAENLLASVEHGAIFGAAFGGATKALGIAGAAAAESAPAKFLADKTSQIGDMLGNKTKAAREFLGITPAKARKLAERDPKFMEDALSWTQEVLEENPNASISEVAAKAKSDLDTVGERIGNTYKKMDDMAMYTGKPNTISAKDLKYKIASTLDEKLMPMFDGVEGASSQVKSLNNTINEIFDGAANAEGNVSAKELHQTLRNLDKQIYDAEGALKSRSLQSEIWRAQRDVIRGELDSAAKLAEKNHPELEGLFDGLKADNRRYRTISSLKRSVEAAEQNVINAPMASFGQKIAAGVGAAISPGMSAVAFVGKKFLDSDALRKMQILGKIEKAQMATKSAIQSGLKGMSETATKLEPVVTNSLVTSTMATELVDGKIKKPKDEQQAYRNILANARQASENPEQFLKNVNRYSSHLYNVAPQTSGALDTAALNAMVYLHSKAPQGTKQKGYFDMSKVDKVNGHEMLKLRQRMDIIQQPTKAIKLLQKGKLGMEHVDTLKAVYPEMYKSMQHAAMSYLSSAKGLKLTYSQKLNLATLLDVKSDESMHFSNVLALQDNFNSPETSSAEGPSSGVVKSTQGGLAKVNKAKRMDTDDANDDV